MTEENVGLRIVNGSDLGKLKNGRATMKHDEATRETKALRFNVLYVALAIWSYIC